MTSSVHVEHPPPINLGVSTRLIVYNSKSSKPKKSVSLFKRKDLALFKILHPASSIAGSSASRNACQDPHNSKDELAGRTFTKDSNCSIPTPGATHAVTPVVALVVTPLIAFCSTNFFVVRYLKDNL